jgi:hypothetical protein
VVSHALIQTLALVIGTAAIVTVVFQRLRLPVVLGYLVAGLLVGPHTSVWFVADAGVVATLAELGVILLMFTIGLELSVRGVIGVGGRAGGRDGDRGRADAGARHLDRPGLRLARPGCAVRRRDRRDLVDHDHLARPSMITRRPRPSAAGCSACW